MELTVKGFAPGCYGQDAGFRQHMDAVLNLRLL